MLSIHSGMGEHVLRNGLAEARAQLADSMTLRPAGRLGRTRPLGRTWRLQCAWRLQCRRLRCARRLSCAWRLGPALLALAFAVAYAPLTRGQPAGTGRTAPTYSQVEVKAAFLYRFGSYVRWPVLTDEADPITIAVLNDPEIATELERFVADRTIDGRTVRVRRLRSVYALEDGDRMLFIGPDENPRLAQIIEAVGEKPILVVTDAPDGLEEGSMINFQVVERRVRFEISLTRARAAGLDLSSRLLAAAIKVETSRCAEQCRDSGGSPARLAADASRHRI